MSSLLLLLLLLLLRLLSSPRTPINCKEKSNLKILEQLVEGNDKFTFESISYGVNEANPINILRYFFTYEIMSHDPIFNFMHATNTNAHWRNMAHQTGECAHLSSCNETIKPRIASKPEGFLCSTACH